MTVKSVRGRRRYLVFAVDETLTREAMIHCIPGGKRFNVIQCAEGRAVVRCAPDELEECSSAVRTVDRNAELITLSGTLKTLRDRYPLLKRTAPPKPRKVIPPAQTKKPRFLRA